MSASIYLNSVAQNKYSLSLNRRGSSSARRPIVNGRSSFEWIVSLCINNLTGDLVLRLIDTV